MPLFLRSFKFSFKSTKARVAQLVEQLICNQQVASSSLAAGSPSNAVSESNTNTYADTAFVFHCLIMLCFAFVFTALPGVLVESGWNVI